MDESAEGLTGGEPESRAGRGKRCLRLCRTQNKVSRRAPYYACLRYGWTSWVARVHQRRHGGPPTTTYYTHWTSTTEPVPTQHCTYLLG